MNDEPARVLVVDDDPDIRTIVGINLGLAGLEIGEASNGQEALDLLGSGDWDACVLDLAMPQTDGLTALKTLREQKMLDDLVVIILSATSSPKRAIEGMEIGAHAHLTKPFSPAAVAEIVKELIDLSPEERNERRNAMLDRAAEMERLGMTTI